MIRPTTFARFGFAFAFVARFFVVFFFGAVMGFFFFASFFFAGGAFNEAAARFSFPAIAFRAEAGTEPPAARTALRFRRIDSRLAFRCSFGSQYATTVQK